MIYQDNPKPHRYTLTAKWPGVKMIFLYMTYMNIPQHRNPCLGVINFYNFGEGFHVETPSVLITSLFYMHGFWKKKYWFLFYNCHLIYHISWIYKMFQQISLKKIMCFRSPSPPYFWGSKFPTLNFFYNLLQKNSNSRIWTKLGRWHTVVKQTKWISI